MSELRAALKDFDRLRHGAEDLNGQIHLVVSTTHDLFSVEGAGLMLIDGEMALRNGAVSDPRIDKLESRQIEHGAGPCITAFDEKELVSCEDLVDESRWGDFSARAVGDGLRAVLASRIPYASDAVGVVAVFSANLAALAVATPLQGEERGELASQLQNALDARVVVEQAKRVSVARGDRSPTGVSMNEDHGPAASGFGSDRGVTPPRADPAAILRARNNPSNSENCAMEAPSETSNIINLCTYWPPLPSARFGACRGAQNDPRKSRFQHGGAAPNRRSTSARGGGLPEGAGRHTGAGRPIRRVQWRATVESALAPS